MKPETSSQPLPSFVSRQVTQARRFFLNLDPNRRSALEVVCGGVERIAPEYVVDRPDFPYFALELVAEGEGTLVLNGKTHALTAGSIFAYGPGTPHTIRNRAREGMRKYYIDFVGTRAPRLLREAGLRTEDSGYSMVVCGALHELTDVFEMLIREAGAGGPLVSPICESLTQLLFQKIRQRRLQEAAAMPQAYATYDRIQRYIEENCLRLHTARQVAEQCDVTPVYLSRLFRRFSDSGAYEFLLRRKMNHAAGLLMNEGLLVKEVAQRLGFADAFQFSRSFKRIYGIPPTKLAQQAVRIPRG